MNWIDGEIEDCLISKIDIFVDERGFLAETFRADELTENQAPAMCYLSSTNTNTRRGPHEHKYQMDNFAFLFGRVRVVLWDARKESPNYEVKQTIICGKDNPIRLLVPPGVVHAYENIGDEAVLIINSPNKLYGGKGRSEEVDEIRHEDVENSPYTL